MCRKEVWRMQPESRNVERKREDSRRPDNKYADSRQAGGQSQHARSGVQIMLRLVVLVKPLAPVMVMAVTMGVLGFLCAIFLTILGSMAVLKVMGIDMGLTMKTIFTLLIICGIFRGILHYAEQLSNHYIAFRILALIRDKIFAALRKLAPAKLEDKEKGNLISIITSDIELLEVFYAHTISPILIAIITSVIMLVFFGRLHPVMAVVAACGYLCVGLFMPWLTSRLGRETGRAYRNEFGAFDSFFLDSLRGLKESIQFGCEEERLGEIKRRSRKLSGQQKTMKNYTSLSIALTGCFVSFFSIVMLFTGIHMYQAGTVTFTQVFLGTVGMMSSFGPVIALSGLANNLLHTFASGNRVLDILDEVPVAAEVTDGTDVAFDGASSEHVDFAYDGEMVLKDFSVEIGKGQVVGINGRSGSGKSTFLKLLMRFWDVKNGRVQISGEDIRRINTKSLREQESFVTQETVLFHDTIENNIKIAKMDATHEEVVEAAKQASLHEFIMTLEKGYDTDAGELGDRLSGGECQRIGIARAFLHDAPLILLDEPTSNLDSLNEGIILKALDKKRGDKTIVLVSHRKSTMNLADKVYNVEHGRVC